MRVFPASSRNRVHAVLSCGLIAVACADDHVSGGAQASTKKHHGASPSSRGFDAGVLDGGMPDAFTHVDGAPPAVSVDASPPTTVDAQSPNGLNPIAAENQQPGTTDWRIIRGASNHEVEGYASAASAAPGDVVTLFINASQAGTVHWELFRLGYYGGAGARRVAVSDPISITRQGECPVDGTTGLVECAWKPSGTVTIDPAWVSGQYLFKLVRDDGFESYVPLVVREGAERRAPILYQSSVTTWQAYNLWGGTSLYANLLPSGSTYTAKRAMKVSFDRPYEYDRPSEEDHTELEFGAGHLFLAELWMLSWLEMKGYDVSYATNLDVDADPHVFDGRRLFLDVGHDEYWTQGERDAVGAARDTGVSLAFFSANDAYWRIRLDPSSSGTSQRIVTCYKSASGDPEGTTPTATIRFRDRPHAQPEDALIGQMYELWTNFDGFPLVVGDASHWIYQGTGVVAGDTLPHIVGYEWDHAFNDGSPSVEIAATSNAFSQLGAMGVSNVTVYYPSASSFVFSAGTIEWAWALGKPGYGDDRVKRITENVISRAGFAPNSPTVVSPPPRPLDVGHERVSVLAGSGESGAADGKATEATFHYPAGVTAFNDVVYVSDHDNGTIRRIASDGTVATFAGCGRRKFADGMGTSACFNLPTGIVAGGDGTLYVADTLNHRVRAIDGQGNVTTFAGSGSDVTQDAADPLAAGIAYPRGIALGPDGALYLASDQTSIRRIGSDGVKTIVTADGEVSGVAVGKDGVVYVVETWAGRVSAVRDGKLVPLVNPLGEFGDVGGPGDTAMLRPADGIAVDGNQLVITDSANYKVRSIALDGDHRVTTLLGDGCAARQGDDGVNARVVNPRGVAVLPAGGYVVADTGNNRILQLGAPAHPGH